MGFIRFVISHRHLESGAYDGTFRLAYRLRGSSVAAPADRSVLTEALNWFEGNIGTPSRRSGTVARGHHRRHTRGICWFKDTAVDHLARMHEIRLVLERYGHQVQMLTEARIGDVVYEDDYQVIAEPRPPGRSRAPRVLRVRQKGQPELPFLVPRTVARGAGYEGFLSVAISVCNSCE